MMGFLGNLLHHQTTMVVNNDTTMVITREEVATLSLDIEEMGLTTIGIMIGLITLVSELINNLNARYFRKKYTLLQTVSSEILKVLHRDITLNVKFMAKEGTLLYNVFRGNYSYQFSGPPPYMTHSFHNQFPSAIPNPPNFAPHYSN